MLAASLLLTVQQASQQSSGNFFYDNNTKRLNHADRYRRVPCNSVMTDVCTYICVIGCLPFLDVCAPCM